MLILSVTAASRTAYAHAPDALRLTYDPCRQVLIVSAQHPVDNPLRHYIYRVDVIVSDVLKQVFYFDRQDTSSTFREELPMREPEYGETITVRAYSTSGGMSQSDLAGSRGMRNDTISRQYYRGDTHIFFYQPRRFYHRRYLYRNDNRLGSKPRLRYPKKSPRHLPELIVPRRIPYCGRRCRPRGSWHDFRYYHRSR